MITQQDPEIQRIREGINRDYEVAHTPNSARALREAADDGLDVVFPEANQLQIDIDDDRAFDIYNEMRPVINRYYGVAFESITPSRSGLPKRHITLTTYRDLNTFERIALQACLGSDRVREILGVVQAMLGDAHPTLFLEKKNATLPVPTGSDRGDSN